MSKQSAKSKRREIGAVAWVGIVWSVLSAVGMLALILAFIRGGYGLLAAIAAAALGVPSIVVGLTVALIGCGLHRRCMPSLPFLGVATLYPVSVGALLFAFIGYELAPYRNHIETVVESSSLSGIKGKTNIQRNEPLNLLEKAVVSAEYSELWGKWDYPCQAIGVRNVYRALGHYTGVWPARFSQPISIRAVGMLDFRWHDGLDRHVGKVVAACYLEQLYTEKEMLRALLAWEFFGRDTYGADAAAEVYFDKQVDDLTLEEAASLAALLRAPNSCQRDLCASRAADIAVRVKVLGEQLQ